jgi:flagellar FliL protein
MSATLTDSKKVVDAEAEEKPAGKKKVIIIALLVLLLGGGGYWFFLKPSGPTPPPKAGIVVALDPVQVNLADGHYLSIGIALQLVDGVAEADGSKALDAVITLYSGQNIDDLIKPKVRSDLQKQLTTQIAKLYEKEVMDVYLTQFVTQ